MIKNSKSKTDDYLSYLRQRFHIHVWLTLSWLLTAAGDDVLAGDGDGAEQRQLVVRQQHPLRGHQGRVLDKLAVAKGVVQDLVLFINRLGVDLVSHRIHHAELHLCSQVGWLLSARIFEKQGDISLVNCLPSIWIHFQPPFGQLSMNRNSKLIRIHGFPWQM